MRVAGVGTEVVLDGGDALGLTAILDDAFSGDWFDAKDSTAVALLEETEGMDLTFEAVLTDACGAVATDEHTVRVAFPWLRSE